MRSYLNSITERKVILVTVNDYLAKRDAEWLGPISENLGISAAYIIPGQNLEERKSAYEANVIYATNNELGFDFLRNNMVVNTNDRMMNDYYFAIIDEVDSILIDEARTPLVISGPAENTAQIYQNISKFIPKLKQQVSEEADEVDEEENKEIEVGHFIVDEKSKQVELTDFGHDFIEKLLKDENLLEEDQSLYSSGNLRLLHYIQSSLRAHFLFSKDVDYMVQNNSVVLIDENTGRAMPGRRLADGLHQAIEQKENVPIQMESQTLASCTFQNYFRQYEKLSGMTGTAATEAEEFAEIYGLNVLEVPTNEPMIRDDKNDLVYLTQAEKYKAVIEEIKEYKIGDFMVLKGYTSTSKSLTVAKSFALNDVPLGRYPVIYKIAFTGDEGLFYLSNSNFSAYQEREVLVQDGLKYKIKSIEEANILQILYFMKETTNTISRGLKGNP